MNFRNESEKRDKVFEVWFRNHYLHLILGSLFIFISLSFIAPILLKTGLLFPAKVIYWMDSFFCHQLPFRSWFLFGDQPYYPLASAGITRMLSFEKYFQPASMEFEVIRFETGNLAAGYKLAICQRDIAMYLSLWVFGMMFAIKNRKIKKLPLWIWIVFGVIPLGLDGGLQFLGNLNVTTFETLVHESTPLLRTITGSLFGLFTGWYIFPTLDSVINTKKIINLEI